MSENKKFTEEELKQVQELRDRMSRLVANFGELKLEQILHEQKTKKLEMLDAQFNKEYSDMDDDEKSKANGVLDYSKWTPPLYKEYYKT